METDDAADPVLRSVAAYTEHAEAYEAAYADRYAGIVARFAASLPAPALVLDAGCGPGRDLARFAAHGHVARGVDLNPAFVARARRHAPTVLADLRAVASLYPPGFFDGVWASASLVHLPAPAMVEVLGQFATILRPGGALFLSVKTAGETGWVDEPDGRRFYTVWPAADLRRVVGDAGFTVDEVAGSLYAEVWATRHGAP